MYLCMSWFEKGFRLREHLRKEARSFWEEVDCPIFDARSLAGTPGDGWGLVRLPQPSGPGLSPLQPIGEGETFFLPSGRRLVILDLGKGRDQLQEIFGPMVPEAAQRPIVEPQDLPSCLQRGDVVLLHGGMANEHAERLGAQGRSALRRHLSEGGCLLGICAGAHWLSCRDLPLWGHVLPAVPHDNANWRRGVGDVTIALTSEGQRILGLPEMPSVSLRYANGPLLVALPEETYNNFQPGRLPEASTDHEEVLLASDALPTPLALFSDCCDERVEGWHSMKGHAAAWAWQMPSGGRVVTLSPHPEYAQTDESRLFFRRLLLWCLGNPEH